MCGNRETTKHKPSALGGLDIAVRALSLLAVFAAAGCGDRTTTVTGVVTLDGKTIAEASVQFYPVNGKGQPAGTITDDSGRYRVTVSPVQQRVVISKREVIGRFRDKTDLVDGGSVMVEERLPARYARVATTPLVADPVESVTTTVDFAISSSTN